jgi:hypothetical protein
VEAASPLAWLFCGGLGTAVVSVCTVALTAAERASLTAWLASGMVAIALPLYLAAAPFGAASVAAVWCLTAWAGAGVGLFLLWRTWGIVPPMASALRGIAVGLLLFWLAAHWSTPYVVFLVMKLAALSLLLLPVALLLSGELTAAEWARICAFRRREAHR